MSAIGHINLPVNEVWIRSAFPLSFANQTAASIVWTVDEAGPAKTRHGRTFRNPQVRCERFDYYGKRLPVSLVNIPLMIEDASDAMDPSVMVTALVEVS